MSTFDENSQSDAGGSLTLKQQQLLSSFERIKDSAQDMIILLLGEYERTLPRNRPALYLVAGGAA